MAGLGRWTLAGGLSLALPFAVVFAPALEIPAGGVTINLGDIACIVAGATALTFGGLRGSAQGRRLDALLFLALGATLLSTLFSTGMANSAIGVIAVIEMILMHYFARAFLGAGGFRAHMLAWLLAIAAGSVYLTWKTRQGVVLLKGADGGADFLGDAERYGFLARNQLYYTDWATLAAAGLAVCAYRLLDARSLRAAAGYTTMVLLTLPGLLVTGQRSALVGAVAAVVVAKLLARRWTAAANPLRLSIAGLIGLAASLAILALPESQRDLYIQRFVGSDSYRTDDAAFVSRYTVWGNVVVQMFSSMRFFVGVGPREALTEPHRLASTNFMRDILRDPSIGAGSQGAIDNALLHGWAEFGTIGLATVSALALWHWRAVRTNIARLGDEGHIEAVVIVLVWLGSGFGMGHPVSKPTLQVSLMLGTLAGLALAAQSKSSRSS